MQNWHFYFTTINKYKVLFPDSGFFMPQMSFFIRHHVCFCQMLTCSDVELKDNSYSTQYAKLMCNRQSPVVSWFITSKYFCQALVSVWVRRERSDVKNPANDESLLRATRLWRHSFTNNSTVVITSLVLRHALNCETNRTVFAAITVFFTIKQKRMSL